MKTPFLLQKFIFIFLLSAATSSFAGSNFTAGEMTIDGQTIRNLDCNLDEGGFMPLLAVVTAIAGQKEGLKSCQSSGGPIDAQWTWSASKTSVQIKNITDKTKAQCYAKAIEKTKGPLGTCSGQIILP
ncbi:MAG: hypothetical protein ACD_73C00812G0005 [uncultured bacterium]|nr:MAG: hypothetical protein ACD_73C00812G0005 [uncultured bacterium]